MEKKIKDALHALREDAKNPNNIMHIPSVYWGNWVETFDYIFDLRVEVVSKIRHHTDILTGSHPSQYFNSSSELRESMLAKYKVMKEGLKDYTFSEPECCGGFGFKNPDDGAILNKDIIRYMQLFSELNNSNMLKSEYNTILEIGGGFGGLAVQFKRNYPNVKYFIVDLPHVLYFSASYIKSNFPKSNIYIYDNDACVDFDKYDFILLAPWAIDSIKNKSIDLVANQASLGEMTESQVDYYLSNIDRVMKDKGVFFSQNKRFNNPWNSELNNS